MLKQSLLMIALCSVVGCSAGTSEEEVVGEAHQALAPACRIQGSSGDPTLPQQSVITEIELGSIVQGQHSLRITSCGVGGGICWTANHVFAEVKWSNVNGNFYADADHPLRRVVVSAPGCQLSQPTKYCFTFYADLDVGSHVNPLQNAVRFLAERRATSGAFSINTGSITVGATNVPAPTGTGIAFIEGVSLATNTWQMKYPNSTATSMLTKNWFFSTPGC